MGSKALHESLHRLLAAAKSATAHLPQSRRVTDFKALKVAMEATNQGWNAWMDRGISKEGALKAEELFGCSATWVLSGVHPKRWLAESIATDQPPANITTSQALPVVLRAIASAPQAERDELVQALSLFAKSGADAYSLRIKELLADKKPRLSRSDDRQRAEVNPRELEHVIGGLIELAGTPTDEARDKGRKIARELMAKKPAASAESAGSEHEAGHDLGM